MSGYSHLQTSAKMKTFQKMEKSAYVLDPNAILGGKPGHCAPGLARRGAGTKWNILGH